MSLNKDHVSFFRDTKHSYDVSTSGRDFSLINDTWDQSPYLKNIFAEVSGSCWCHYEGGRHSEGNKWVVSLSFYSPFFQPWKFICIMSVMLKYSTSLLWMTLLYDHAFLRDKMLVFEKLNAVHCNLISNLNNVKFRLLLITPALTVIERQSLLLC